MIDTNSYRIFKYLKDVHKESPLDEIDYKRHCLANVTLVKVVEKDRGERPIHALYYKKLEDGTKELILKIVWKFHTTSDNFIYRKEKHLCYLHNDGETWSDSVFISEEENDLTTLEGIRKAMRERVQARQAIFESMTGFLSGALRQFYGMTQEEILEETTPFLNDFDKVIRDFIKYGKKDWRVLLQALDLEDDAMPYEFLTIPMDGPGNIRNYLTYRLDH